MWGKEVRQQHKSGYIIQAKMPIRGENMEDSCLRMRFDRCVSVTVDLIGVGRQINAGKQINANK